MSIHNGRRFKLRLILAVLLALFGAGQGHAAGLTPHEQTYFAGVKASAAGANKVHLSVYNAAGSGRTLRVLAIRAAGAPTAAVTGLVIPLYAARISGTIPSGGTALTFSPAVVANPALPGQFTVRTGATTIGTEDPTPFGAGVVSGEETAGAVDSELYRFAEGQPVTLEPGEGFVVKQGALASAGAVNVVAVLTVWQW